MRMWNHMHNQTTFMLLCLLDVRSDVYLQADYLVEHLILRSFSLLDSRVDALF